MGGERGMAGGHRLNDCYNTIQVGLLANGFGMTSVFFREA